MVLIRQITDADVSFEARGRIVVRNHNTGVKGVLVVKRDSCPYCLRAKGLWNKLASEHADNSVVYVVDMEDPSCQTLVNTFELRGVPSFYRVNGVGRVQHTEEFSFDWTNEDVFLMSIRRQT